MQISAAQEYGAIDRSRFPRRNVLLLQGPTGLFFKELQLELEHQGGNTKHVLFNAADELYSLRRDQIRFSGTVDEWEGWLRSYLAKNTIDVIVYFGCKRPAHVVAARLAGEFGIEAISLEEGYIRSGYITCEQGGNNDLSPIMGKLPQPDQHYIGQERFETGPTFAWMNWWSMTYYLWRSWFSRETDKHLYHIEVMGPWKDTLFWMANALRTIFKKFLEARTISKTIKHFDKDYILVPLQLPSDSQMREAANGWSIERLVCEVLTSFAKNRSVRKVVFKLHPLDGKAIQRTAFIKNTAERLGVAGDIVILHTGSIAKLCVHSDGMIIVNSTSGISAIHHGTPLLVLGKAIFRNEDLVMCGSDEDSIAAFFDKRWAASASLRQHYLEFIKARTLLAGDYYSPKGCTAAARNLVRRLLKGN